MTTHMKRKSAIAGAAVLLVALIAGCSADTTKEFCDAASGESPIDELDPSDPAQLSQALKELEKIKAPAEIESDWATTIDAFKTMVDATDGLEAGSDEYNEALVAVIGDIDTEKMETSSTNISNFITENCEA